MKAMIRNITFSITVIVHFGFGHAQSSPAIDSILLAIEENRKNCTACGHLCAGYRFRLQADLSKQYYIDGFPDKAFSIASNFVFVSRHFDYNPGYTWDLFLELLSKQYSKDKLRYLIDNVKIKIYEDVIISLFLEEKDSIDRNTFSEDIKYFTIYILLDDIEIIVASNLLESEDYYSLFQAMVEKGVGPYVFTNNEIQKKWEGSRLYSDLVSLTEE